MKTGTAIKIALTCLVLTAGNLSAQEYKSMVVFGDSLSDPGNYFQLFGEQEIMLFEPDNLPGAPYPFGGHHFTNGETWIEQLSREAHLQTSGSPAYENPGMFQNYAVGRSRARNEYLDGVFSAATLTTQVSDFINDFGGGKAPQDALYIVWIGTNDMADALGAVMMGDYGLSQDVLGSALTTTVTQISRLILNGARDIAVMSVPDLTLTPRVSSLVESICIGDDICKLLLNAQISGIIAYYNTTLIAAVHNQAGLLEISLDTSIDIVEVNPSVPLQQAIDAPQTFGLTNVQDACLKTGTIEKVFCERPSEYLFFDGQHITRAGHKILANYVMNELDIE